MAVILWGAWQKEHITKRHRVSANDFDAAWHDPWRQDLAMHRHARRGSYYVSVGFCPAGKSLKMVWRWQAREESVWPITAFFPSRRSERRNRRGEK